MFVDSVSLKLVAGRGGDGIVAWRREKFLPKGGPYGGNGGRGGSVVIASDPNRFSLAGLRGLSCVRAGNGKIGGVNGRQGACGKDCVVRVPCGTVVKASSTGCVLRDFVEPFQAYTVCLGGKGGKGNLFFTTSVNQAPERRTLGEEGEVGELFFELKLLADVGLVGLPSAGKSTLLNAATSTHVATASYPFTTLYPNIGWFESEDCFRFSFVDLPGLIEGARFDKGLGHTFLKHIERASIVVIVVACGEVHEGGDPYGDFLTVREALSHYSTGMAEKPFLVALNKADRADAREYIKRFRRCYAFSPNTLFEISALRRTGLGPLLGRVSTLLKASASCSASVCS